jgi:hypothetical protein
VQEKITAFLGIWGDCSNAVQLTDLSTGCGERSGRGMLRSQTYGVVTKAESASQVWSILVLAARYRQVRTYELQF